MNTNFAQKLSATHGTFNSFSALADALGVKASEKREPSPMKCSNCGGPMHRAGNSNVWVCDFHKLTDEKLPDGTDVQVFTKCENTVIERI